MVKARGYKMGVEAKIGSIKVVTAPIPKLKTGCKWLIYALWARACG